jgi:predicted acyl esterase
MWWTAHYDDYDTFLEAGTAGELARQRGMEQLGFWRKILEHPTYDAFWREQAVDRVLAARPLTVPVMLVHSPGHRMMVQVQSSWFPLYDRNPQTFVPSIFWAKPEDFKKATQRVYHAPGQRSFVELPLVTTP